MKGDNFDTDTQREIEKRLDQQKVWDILADGWYNFRQKPFPPLVEKIALSWKKGKILDVGCGNCRNLVPFAQLGFDCYGIDFSKNMIGKSKEFCEKNRIRVRLRLAQAEKLPFSSSSFDYCLSVASLHHVGSSEYRKRSILEMCRILKNGGKALVTVWNKIQPRFLLKSKHQYVSWRRKGKAYYRYYYLYNYWELKKLLEKCGFNILYSTGPFDRMLTFIVKKP